MIPLLAALAAISGLFAYAVKVRRTNNGLNDGTDDWDVANSPARSYSQATSKGGVIH